MLPDPRERPLLKPAELVGLIPGKRKSAIYEAIRRGDLPSVRVGRSVYVPTAELRRLWGLEPTPSKSEGRPASRPAALTLTSPTEGGPDAHPRTTA